jgi:RNA polymerase sigma-70 factor (ECF subfamily)
MGDEPVARAQVDSATAFESALRGSARPMLQFADFVLDDLSAAEDALQDAFVIAWRRRKRLKAEADFRASLRRIVVRECLRWRRHPMFRVLALRDRVVAQADPQAKTQRDVAREVGRLSPKARAVAFLHFYEGLTVAQVASELRIPTSMVKIQLGTATELGSAVRRYAAERSGRISENQAAGLVSRAARRWSQRRTFGRHIVNLLSAATLALVIAASGIVLQSQLHLFQARPPSATSSGPLPPMPKEIINLILPSMDPGLVMPFPLRYERPLAPRPQWIVGPGAALQIAPASDCSTTTVRVVDPVTQKDVRPAVALPDCNDTPVILPDGTVLLNHAQAPAPRYFRSGVGAVRYDWRAGHIVKQYPNLSLPPDGGLVSKDGNILYSLDIFSGDASRGTFLDFTDLASGAPLAHIPIVLPDSGAVSGGLALSMDRKTLFVNEGYQLASFDAVSGAAGPAVPFSDGKSAARWSLPSWLPSMTEVEANGGDAGHGIAVDPKGRRVAAVGYNDIQLRGIWILGASGRLPVLRHFYQSGVLSDIAFSLDGSVLYAIDAGGLVVFDAATGREIKRFGSPTLGSVSRIAGVQAQ